MSFSHYTPSERECPDCNGTGKIYRLWDALEHRDAECDEDEYTDAFDNDELNYDDEQLLKLGHRYSRLDICECPACEGCGTYMFDPWTDYCDDDWESDE